MNERHDFISDTVAGAMPEVVEAIVTANSGAVAGYGSDPVTQRAADLIRAMLDADADVRFVASGTAANSLALQCLAQPHEAVLGHAHAHIMTDESGAPGFFGGGLGLIGLPGESGRISLPALEAALAQPDSAHHQSAAALSLTTATEYGTVYSEAGFAALVGLAKAKGYGVHLDGARLANAVAAGFDPKSITRAGVDILILGGTKAGSTPTEAVVILNKRLSRRLDARLKHMGQLVSKSRFLAAPWLGLLDGPEPAWRRRAAHANAMARKLASLMPFPIRHPVEANGVFVDLDDDVFERLAATGWVVYRVLDGSTRFMCSWATTPALVEELGAALVSLSETE